MPRNNFYVVQNSGGVIMLFVLDEYNECIYAHTEYEEAGEKLLGDIHSLRYEKFEKDHWEGCEEDHASLWEDVRENLDKGYKIIADEENIFLQKMTWVEFDNIFGGRKK